MSATTSASFSLPAKYSCAVLCFDPNAPVESSVHTSVGPGGAPSLRSLLQSQRSVGESTAKAPSNVAGIAPEASSTASE